MAKEINYLEQIQKEEAEHQTRLAELREKAKEQAKGEIAELAEKLEAYHQNFPDLVRKAVRFASEGEGNDKGNGKSTGGGGKLTKVEMEELKGKVSGAITAKIKQVDFIAQFMTANPGYKETTVKKILNDMREAKTIKTEPVEKGAPLKGIWLIPAKG